MEKNKIARIVSEKEKELEDSVKNGDAAACVKEKETEIKMPTLLTVTPSPHIKTRENTASIMIDVLIALTPAFLYGVYIFGLRAVWIALVSVVSSVGFEALCEFILHKKVTVSDCSAAVTGILIAMNLPVSVPLWMPFVGGFFAIVVVKQLFGGIGKNFVNPALSARVFLLSWASEMTRFTYPLSRLSEFSMNAADSDIIASATPLASLKNGVLPYDSITDMIFGKCAGCIGEVSSILLLAGGIYLLIRRVITWHIPVSYLGTVAIITFIFPKNGADNLSFMLYELFAGGLILGAVFMATDYATSPVTPRGHLIFGAGCGVITVLIRYFGAYPEGVSFSILIMNLLVWYIDKAAMPRRFGGVGNAKK